jgi:hypothetical protein
MGLLFGNFYLTRERRSKPRGSITRWRSDFLERRDIVDGGGFGETDGEHPCELPDPSCYALASACTTTSSQVSRVPAGPAHSAFVSNSETSKRFRVRTVSRPRCRDTIAATWPTTSRS